MGSGRDRSPAEDVLTEIPEHLLQRSRERRAALGLGGGDAGQAAPAAASDTPGTEVTPAATAAPTPAAPVAPEVKAPEPLPHYVEASMRRTRIPIWAVPVLAGLVFWAPIYIGTLDAPEVGGPLQAGGGLYAVNCAGCHGAAGGGGVGRQLSDGEVLLTYPEWQGHAEIVINGNTDLPDGAAYGDPDRPGGPHLAGGGPSGTRMPGFSASLSTVEILEIVLYERVTHGGADMESDDIVSLLEAIDAVAGGQELDLGELAAGG
jgi:mono/diheme cytochrome c family protein